MTIAIFISLNYCGCECIAGGIQPAQADYYQVTRGTAQRRHAFPAGKGNLWVTLTPCEMNDGTTPLRLITREDTRFFHCDIKTLNLIPSVMAAQEAEEKGCQETVFYRPGGRVTECAHSNVHILKGGTLYTAPADNLILPGIARAHLLRACKALGIPAREEPYTLEDLRNADEILVTSSGGVCRGGAGRTARRHEGRKDL